MTLQEIFDTVAKHLLTQKVRAWSTTIGAVGGCAYRGDDGTKCAVGCLIPDEMYSKAMENRVAREVLRDHPELCKHLGITHLDSSSPAAPLRLLGKLQTIHDSRTPSMWKDALQDLVVSYPEFDLNFDVLKNF